MSEFFNVRVDLEGAAAGVARFEASRLTGRIAEGVKRGMDRANLSILGRVRKERFTGQGPFAVSQNKLGVDSGQLRRGLRAAKAVLTNPETLEVLSKVGTNRRYFGAHEFGFKGAVNVRAHTRRTRVAKIKRKEGRGKIKVRKATRATKNLAGGKIAGVRAIQVRAHKRRMNIPERKPLRTGFAELKARAVYQREITKAVAAAVAATK